MDVTLIDSPVANAANIARALRAAGGSLHVTRDPEAIARAAKIVLPGVGTFTAAMRWLEETRVDSAIRNAVQHGATLLGICVGHQLLFDVSYEMGVTRGLGLVHGEVRQYEGTLPVPQIGWNCVVAGGDGSGVNRGAQPLALEDDGRRVGTPGVAGNQSESHQSNAFSSPLFDGIEPGTAFYFVNSFAASNVASEIARADYGGPFTAAVQSGRVFGVQFHPEKSSTAGLRILRNFVEKIR